MLRYSLGNLLGLCWRQGLERTSCTRLIEACKIQDRDVDAQNVTEAFEPIFAALRLAPEQRVGQHPLWQLCKPRRVATIIRDRRLQVRVRTGGR